MNYPDKSSMFLTYWRMLNPGFRDPQPEYQFAIHARRKFRFDWAFIEPRIAIKMDGGQWAYGGGRHAKDSDRVKQNLAAELGWLVFHFSPDMLKRDPQACIEQVVRALENQK